MKKRNTIDELKMAITDLINGIPRKMLKKLFRNRKRWVKTCLENEGGHFEHILLLLKKMFFLRFSALLFLVAGCIVHGSPCTYFGTLTILFSVRSRE